MAKLAKKTALELLGMITAIGEELRDRGIVRSANNPTGDLAEFLFCNAFGWTQGPNSKLGYDATDTDGTRYQIKGRRLHQRNKSRQLSAIRDLAGNHFDVLAGVLFDDNYNVTRAAFVPIEIVKRRSTFVERTNSSKFMLYDDVWNLPEVTDVTKDVAAQLQ